MMFAPRWNRRFLELAAHVASWSKDPSTKTGAVIVDERRRIVSVGYNGFPRGVRDDAPRLDYRAIKYEITLHCEANAILFASRSLEGCVLYTYPFLSCSRCASMVVQVGICCCIAPVPTEDVLQRWAESLALTRMIYNEAGVRYEEIEEMTAKPSTAKPSGT